MLSLSDNEFYQRVRDPRGYLDVLSGPSDWRRKLREQVFADRGGLSDLTKRPLTNGFDLHEGIYQRHWAGKNTALQNILFSGPNLFILLPEEHRVQPPSPATCYWLSIVRYGKDYVERWIASLPWKVSAEESWRGSYGREVIARIPETYRVAPLWYQWFKKIEKLIDYEA